jgi:putative ABC transport system permease protein
MPVAAIYTDLRESPPDRYWCTVRRLYEGEPGQEFSNNPIPALLLADLGTLFSTVAALGGDLAQDVDFTLVDPTPTRPAAGTVVADVDLFAERLKGDPT